MQFPEGLENTPIYLFFNFRTDDGYTMAKLTKEKVKGCLKGSALTLATLAGVIGGVIFGLSLRQRAGMHIF